MSTNNKLQIAVPVVTDRHLPVEIYGEAVKALENSECVDVVQMWDQMTGWNPPWLWSPERTPMARVQPDIDSFPDWFPMIGYAAAVAPSMGVSVSIDSCRRAPAELIQSMLTAANITKGKVAFHVGAGELKQVQPFGHNRKQRIGRMEDFFRVYDAFRRDPDKPISFEGKYTTLDHAWLGGARNYEPTIWGVGGGPKILDLSTTYADGFATMGVMVRSDPDYTKDAIKKLKEQLISKGRDPDKFGFGAYIPCLVHEDEALIDRALDNDLSRWHAAIWGRINQADWDREGLPAPMGKDWHYANDLLPVRVSEAEGREIMNRATRQHVEKSYLYGSPEDVARQMKAFVEAGVNWIGILDVMPMLLEPEDAAMGLGRSIKIARLLKE